MTSYLIALLLLVLTLVLITLRKTYFYLPPKELKRQAEAGDSFAKTLWRAACYGDNLDILLWLLIGVASAGMVVLFARVAPPFIGVLAVLLVVWVAFAWLPRAQLSSFGARLAEFCTPALAWLLGLTSPALDRLATILRRAWNPRTHTGIFERDDLIDLLQRQQKQTDNRMTPAELAVVTAALQFNTLLVRDVLVPRDAVVSVSPNDTVSPVYLDDLHKSLHTRFPVIKDETVVGTLFLRDITLIGEGKGVKGKVENFMDRQVVYVHEADSLADVLQVFYETKQQLFVVVDSFEAYIGIIMLDDVLYRLLGPDAKAEFGFHDSLRAVAGKHAKKEPKVDAELVAEDNGEIIEVDSAEIPTETDEKVVE